MLVHFLGVLVVCYVSKVTLYKIEEMDSITAVSETTTPSQPHKDTEDLTAKVIGDFGKWQFWISFWMTLLKLPMAWYQLNIIFMAPPQDFWCVKPKNFARMSEEEWRRICSPLIQEHPCLIYDPNFLSVSPVMDRSLIPLVLCKKFVYDTSAFKRTIMSDWNLVCSRHWLVHLTQCIMMWGVLLGGLIFGTLADKYGRRIPLMIGIVLQSFFSYVVTFTPGYWVFLMTWFALALASGGISIISFVICMEAVSGKYRTTIPVLYQLPFGLGNAVMAGLAYWLRDWRKLEFALATLSAIYICCWFIIPESPRWLLATGQTDKALEVLKAAAKCNNRPFNEQEVKGLLTNLKHRKRNTLGFISFFKTNKMRLRTTLLSINWFCTGLSFYTFSQYVGSIGSNIFLAVALSGIISTLGGIVCFFIITKVGRKTTVAVFQVTTAVCFMLLLIMPKNFANDWPRLLCAGIGFAGMAGSIPALYLLSGELFPTLDRNIGVSGVTMFARVASMMAPAVVSLDSYLADLPLILLAFMSFSQIFLLLPLPETKDKPLPDTMEQAEQLK